MKIHILDTRFQGMAQVTAVYLLVGPEGPVLVETGPATTLPAVRDALAELGYRPADISHILVTHIHLDHAGAAGWWARQGARIYVHHIGAPHLIDPSKLLVSAGRIYGEAMDRLWGETLPCPAEQVTALYDGDTVEAGGLTLTALDTPGHAYHHHAYMLDTPDGRIAFTGDAAGVNLPLVDVIDLPAPPPEFHLETWLATLDRLESQDFATIYPTHFGPVGDVHGHLSALRQLLHDAVAFVAEQRDAGVERDALLAEYIAWNRRRAASRHLSPQAIERYELANPLFMSVDGILRYLKKMER